MSFDSPQTRRANLQALKSHSIFALAATRPLAPAEVDTYLSIKAQISQLESTSAPAPTAKPQAAPQRAARSTAFDL